MLYIFRMLILKVTNLAANALWWMKNKNLNRTLCNITEYGLQQLSYSFVNIDATGWMWKEYKHWIWTHELLAHEYRVVKKKYTLFQKEIRKIFCDYITMSKFFLLTIRLSDDLWISVVYSLFTQWAKCINQSQKHK